MIAVDSNILIYAHRRDSPHHPAAARQVTSLAEGQEQWAIPWPCLHEFFSIVTARIYTPASTWSEAVDQIDIWMASPSLVLLAESERHWSVLRGIIAVGRIRGASVHNARIAAICLQHSVRELWSADRDFRRFPQLKVVNPLVL